MRGWKTSLLMGPTQSTLQKGFSLAEKFSRQKTRLLFIVFAGFIITKFLSRLTRAVQAKQLKSHHFFCLVHNSLSS